MLVAERFERALADVFNTKRVSKDEYLRIGILCPLLCAKLSLALGVVLLGCSFLPGVG